MCTAMHVFMIALMVQSGLAIKCFNCVSEMDKECDKIDQSLPTQECNDEKQAELEREFRNDGRHFLLRISDFYYHRPPNSKPDSAPPMVCQKLVGIDDKQNKMVVRRCQLANVECNDSYGVLASKFPNNHKVEVCEICKDKDGCNGSSSNQTSGVVMGISVVIVSVCRHLGL